ncbi:MAG: AraC family transcriptional regulator, partial [Acholeplasmatales bacterium]|nr:AraC family transcriptional regulator [Acholeplasmatales bacterium]
IEKNKYKISILENLFKRLIDNNSDNTQTILSIKDNDIILENKFIHLVLFSLDNLTEISLSDEGYLFLQNEISKSIYKDDFILFRRNKYFYLYIFLEIDPNIYELGTFLTSLINKLKVKFSFKTYACISRVFTTNDSFYNIYLETKRTLDFASEENEVFYPPSDYKVDFEFVEEKWYKALSNIINSKGTGDAILFINQKISELKNKSHIAFQLFISECLNTIISTSNNKVKTNSMTINTDIYQKILSENNIFTTLNYFTELINAIKKANKEEIFNIQETNSKYLLDYLNNSFTDPMLSLHYVSKEIGLSPSYIAFLLKSYSDTTFVKYVTILRIDYAKKLIASNKYKITAISKMVGYQDPYYFSHCFKKYSGVSPKNYIEK